PLEALDDALVVRRGPSAQGRRSLAAVQECVALLRCPVAQGSVGIEGADVGVLLVPVSAVAEAGQEDRSLGQAAVEVEEAVDRGGDDLAQARARRAHAAPVVEGETRGLPDVRLARPGEEQSEVAPGVGDRAHRGAGVPADAALVDDDDWREAVDGPDRRSGPLREPVPGEGREGLVELVAGLGGDGVEDEGGLAGPGDPCDDDEPVATEVQVEVVEVVGLRVADADRLFGHESTLRADGDHVCPLLRQTRLPDRGPGGGQKSDGATRRPRGRWGTRSTWRRAVGSRAESTRRGWAEFVGPEATRTNHVVTVGTSVVGTVGAVVLARSRGGGVGVATTVA